jgi:hypothetical protein
MLGVITTPKIEAERTTAALDAHRAEKEETDLSDK